MGYNYLHDISKNVNDEKNKELHALGPWERESSPSRCFKDSLPIEAEKWAARYGFQIEGRFITGTSNIIVVDVRQHWYNVDFTRVCHCHGMVGEIKQWVTESIEGLASFSIVGIWFSHKTDVVMYKLRWGEYVRIEENNNE